MILDLILFQRVQTGKPAFRPRCSLQRVTLLLISIINKVYYPKWNSIQWIFQPLDLSLYTLVNNLGRKMCLRRKQLDYTCAQFIPLICLS